MWLLIASYENWFAPFGFLLIDTTLIPKDLKTCVTAFAAPPVPNTIALSCLFVKNGFGIHPMFNTVHGNKNRWGIGSEDAPQSEADFYDKLSFKILSYDTLYR
jgi:hypothetical protein